MEGEGMTIEIREIEYKSETEKRKDEVKQKTIDEALEIMRKLDDREEEFIKDFDASQWKIFVHLKEITSGLKDARARSDIEYIGKYALLVIKGYSIAVFHKMIKDGESVVKKNKELLKSNEELEEKLINEKEEHTRTKVKLSSKEAELEQVLKKLQIARKELAELQDKDIPTFKTEIEANDEPL